VYYGYGMGAGLLNSPWLLIMIFSVALGAATQWWVSSRYKRFGAIALRSGLTGADVARRILDAAGLQTVGIQMIGGTLTDNFDPRTGTLSLSQAVYEGRNIASAGVAAHEAGHAIQHARGYVFATIRGAIVPVANIGSQAAPFLIILGLVLGAGGGWLLWLGIALYAGAVLFQIVTLPVELDASRRALTDLQAVGVVDDQELPGARSVLTAAAMTYVAAALISVIYLLYYVGLARRS
jgi:Zn-dependent membrane protease YugP